MAWTEPPRTWVDGELENATILNQHIRDQFKAIPHVIAVKSADESIASSTVLQNDDHLLFTPALNDIWYLRFVLWITAGGGDLKWTTTWPAGSTGAFNVIGGDTNVHQNSSGGTGQTETVFNVGDVVEILGFLIAGAATAFTLQWAQNVSNASATILKKGSMLIGTKLF